MRTRLYSIAEQKRSAQLFAALGDETRLRLISRLCDDGPISITKLTVGSNVTRQAITKHLRIMEESGLVRSKRRGRETAWQLDERRLEDARVFLDKISEHWDKSLLRLRQFVEDEKGKS